jgi:putative NADH-flavin reductase
MKICIVGASGKLGQYMVQHALDRGYEVVGVCREQSVGKLDRFKRAGGTSRATARTSTRDNSR